MAPKDASIQSVNGLLRRRVEDHPNSVVVTVPDKLFNYTTYTFHELDQVVSKLTRHLATKPWVTEKISIDKAPVIGFLSKSGFHYAVHTLALSRLGWTVLFLSPNNSPAALEHLLRRTDCSTILVQSDLVNLASQAKTLVDQHVTSQLCIETFADSSVWEDAYDIQSYPARYDEEAESGHVAFIIHSSGSTGFPKPIFITHSASVHNFATNVNLRGLITLPLYHAHGHSSLFRSLYSVKNICLYPPELPITAANVIKALQDTSAEVFYAVPFVLKLLAESKEGIDALVALKIVMFGGSACPDGLGNTLTEKGVNLLSHYGMTEVGQLMTSQRDFNNDKRWEWVRAGEAVRPYLRFEEQGEGTYELVVLPGWKSKVMSNRSDGSYASKDIFAKHPSIPHAYKFVGRLDDTITLYSGEKTNPIRYENVLRESHLIKDAIVFGNGQLECGVLILPAKPVELMSNFKADVQWILDKANSQAESHAQITNDMMHVLPHYTTLPRADKGTILRPAVYREFAAKIEQMYQKDQDPSNKERFTPSELKDFLRRLVFEALPSVRAGLQDDSDLFSLGLDSLKSMKIRNSIVSHVDVNDRPISINIVYEHATIQRLSKFLINLQEGVEEKEDESMKMLELVERYSNFENSMNGRLLGMNSVLQNKRVGSRQSKGHTVLMTGASGSLGAHVLTSFLSNPAVSQIYCLVRASTDSAAFRKVEASLRTRNLISYSTDRRITCLAASLGKPLFGLSKDTYNEIASKLTVVVHDGWAVNFSLGVDSFEVDCISGLRNLLQLCLSCPETLGSFYFVSSISATAGPAAPQIVLEQHYQDPHIAQEMGYARSKWVGERIVERATRTIPSLRASVLRLGQLIGDQQHGIWNTSEAISLMIKSGDVMGVLPDLRGESVCWLPVDAAAAFCVEAVLKDQLMTTTGKVWNVVHPETVPWQKVLKWLGESGLDFEVATTSTWIHALEKSESIDGPERNPAVKLIGFWKGKYGEEDEAVGKGGTNKADKPIKLEVRTWETQVKAQSLNKTIIERFVGAWRNEGFLKRRSLTRGIDQ